MTRRPNAHEGAGAKERPRMKRAASPKDLYFLRKSEGLTRGRLRRRPALCVLAGVQPDDAEGALARIRAELDDMGHGVKVAALRHALALDMDDPGRLTDRRDAFARKRGVEPDTVENWENDAFAELFERLRRYTFRASVVIDSAESLVIVRRRLIAQVAERRTVVAQLPGVEDFSYETGPTSFITPLTGQEWIELARNATSSTHSVLFKPPLPVGKPYTYDFRVDDPEEQNQQPGEVGYYSQYFSVPTGVYRLRVIFKDEGPLKVWRFADRPLVMVETDEPLAEEVLAIDADGVAKHTFKGLPGNGLPTGIAWLWTT